MVGRSDQGVTTLARLSRDSVTRSRFTTNLTCSVIASAYPVAFPTNHAPFNTQSTSAYLFTIATPQASSAKQSITDNYASRSRITSTIIMDSNKQPTIPSPLRGLKHEITQINHFELMIQQCEDFLGILSDLHLPSPSFRFTIQEPFGTPSVRTQVHYLAAIKMILDLRKRLRCGEMVTHFWKARAKANGHEDLITPSSSYASSVDSTLDASNPCVYTDRGKKKNLSLDLTGTEFPASNLQLQDRNSSPSAPGSFGDCIGIEDEDYILRRMNFRDPSNSEMSDQEHAEAGRFLSAISER
jgi:hypothetical protein